MVFYFFTGFDSNDEHALERRNDTRPDHKIYVKNAQKDNVMPIGFLLLDRFGEMSGSAALLNFENKKALDNYFENEPYVKKGVWEPITYEASIENWNYRSKEWFDQRISSTPYLVLDYKINTDNEEYSRLNKLLSESENVWFEAKLTSIKTEKNIDVYVINFFSDEEKDEFFNINFKLHKISANEPWKFKKPEE